MNRGDIRWQTLCPKENEEDARSVRTILPELYRVALDAFGKWLPAEAIESRTAEASLVMVLYQEERILGYAVNDLLTLAGKEVNYFASGFLRREMQGNGLYSEMNRLRVDLLPSDIIMTRTQNPIVYAQFRKLCEEKRYKFEPQGEVVREETLAIAQAYSPEVERSMIVRGVYWKRSLMDDTPTPRGDLEKRIWSNLNVKNGDAVIIVGRRKEDKRKNKKKNY